MYVGQVGQSSPNCSPNCQKVWVKQNWPKKMGLNESRSGESGSTFSQMSKRGQTKLGKWNSVKHTVLAKKYYKK
jgi:hypothetical protein